MLRDAMPKSILAVSISPKLSICPPIAKSSWKRTRQKERRTMPILMPNLSRRKPINSKVKILGSE